MWHIARLIRILLERVLSPLYKKQLNGIKTRRSRTLQAWRSRTELHKRYPPCSWDHPPVASWAQQQQADSDPVMVRNAEGACVVDSEDLDALTEVDHTGTACPWKPCSPTSEQQHGDTPMLAYHLNQQNGEMSAYGYPSSETTDSRSGQIRVVRAYRMVKYLSIHVSSETTEYGKVDRCIPSKSKQWWKVYRYGTRHVPMLLT